MVGGDGAGDDGLSEAGAGVYDGLAAMACEGIGGEEHARDGGVYHALDDDSEIFLDFAYPDVKLAIEADSFVWHASLTDWQRDRARNNELVALGWSILPITWDLVIRSSAEAARQVRGAREARLAVTLSSR